jgi:cation:H+ antiporter
MSPLLALTLVGLGIVLLTGGGELLVRGAVSLARILRLAPAVIGLTIVAVGTSLPELAVSLLAGLEDRVDLAVGNVVGSNIFNVAAILGLAALIFPLGVHGTAVRLEWPVMALLSFQLLLLARDGLIDRLEGGFLLMTLVAFTAYLLRIAQRDVSDRDAEELASSVASWSPQSRRVAASAGFVAVGIVLLVAGAQALVSGASALATAAGVSERVVGLTIVAAGTSLPELAASVVAAWRQQTGIALANVIGSNIFNIAGILGLVSLVEPQHVAPAIVASDLWWMVGIALALFPLMITGMRISRSEGGLLLGAYLVYLATLLR